MLAPDEYRNAITINGDQLHDSLNGTRKLTRSLNVARYQHTESILTDRNVLGAAEYRYLFGPLNTAEVCDPLTRN